MSPLPPYGTRHTASLRHTARMRKAHFLPGISPFTGVELRLLTFVCFHAPGVPGARVPVHDLVVWVGRKFCRGAPCPRRGGTSLRCGPPSLRHSWTSVCSSWTSMGRLATPRRAGKVSEPETSSAPNSETAPKAPYSYSPEQLRAPSSPPLPGPRDATAPGS